MIFTCICIGIPTSINRLAALAHSAVTAAYCMICQHNIYISNGVLSADGYGCAVMIACNMSPTLCAFLIGRSRIFSVFCTHPEYTSSDFLNVVYELWLASSLFLKLMMMVMLLILVIFAIYLGWWWFPVGARCCDGMLLDAINVHKPFWCVQLIILQ